MSVQDTVWQGAELTQAFLEGVRGAIPLATEQIDIMLRLVRAAKPTVNTILDLGCGDGILGHALLDKHPEATAVFVDFSPPMLAAARHRLAHTNRATFLQLDYSQPGWIDKLIINNSQFTIHNSVDVIV
ncbi:MAG: class I SAM-dependent methyltransferase, partial [Anaerolineae bacterium]